MIRVGHFDKSIEFDIEEFAKSLKESIVDTPHLPNRGVRLDEFDKHLQRVRNEDLDDFYTKVWRTIESID